MSPKPVEELAAKGARIATKLADAVTGADAVVTMLPSTPHVRDVYEGTVFTSARPGTLLIDCSTIDPTYTRALGAQAGTRKLRFVDAPVSGGTGGAEAGTLTFMVGGAPADFEAVKGILQAMGKNIVHCGGVGEEEEGRRGRRTGQGRGGATPCAAAGTAMAAADDVAVAGASMPLTRPISAPPPPPPPPCPSPQALARSRSCATTSCWASA